MSKAVFRSATAMARAIRAGKLTSVDATTAHLDHIARHNDRLRALVLVDRKGALARARAADRALARGEVWGPLHGVPITIKEAFDAAGWKTTSSHPPLAGNVAARDATAVARLRGAGAVILGKTNVPELCQDVQSNSPLFGDAANPWDDARTPGGSTGGGAAAVAAGFSPLELGSDIGGSVRIPAHFCGVYGLKTSEWRVPGTGHVPDLPSLPRAARYMGTFGFLSRSVADLRLALELCAGPDGIDTEVPPVPLTAEKSRPLSALRLAWSADWPLVPASEDTRRAVTGFVRRLAREGATVKRALPEGLDWEQEWLAWSMLVAFMMRTFQPLEERQRFFDYATSDNPSRRAVGIASRLEMPEFARTLARRDAVIATVERFLDGYDAWIAPVAPFPAFPRQRSGAPLSLDGREIPYWQGATAYSFLANLTGQPAITIPVGRSAEGLPIGIQLIGKRWGEMKLLAIAAQIERLLGPVPRPPGY